MNGIAIIGPESSGKTSLCEFLSSKLSCPMAKEYAREFLEHTHGKYAQADLIKMAETQFHHHKKMAGELNQVWLADTEATVIKIWSAEKYGSYDPMFDQLIDKQPFDFYLLCKPDIPWKYDPLREVPDIKDRERIFNMLKEELESRGYSYSIVSGLDEERHVNAFDQIKSNFKSLRD